VNGQQYRALIHSVMCYNGETWPVTASDTAYLEGAHFRLLRCLIAKSPDEQIHVSQARVLQVTDAHSAWSKTYSTGRTCNAAWYHWRLQTERSKSADQTRLALDTAHNAWLFCCENWFLWSRTSSNEQNPLPSTDFCTHIPLWIKRSTYWTLALDRQTERIG